MPSSFYKVKCKDCGNVQIVFSKASTSVQCQVCGSILASPGGGKAKIKGEILAELKYAKRTA